MKHMGVLFRLFAATPDAITAAVFLIAWIDPSILGPQYVKDLMLTMLIEFVVMHSSAFYSGLAASSDVPRARRAMTLTGLSAFYLLFVGGMALTFESSWPLFAFAWLFASRFVHLWMHPVQIEAESRRMSLLWAASALAYVAGAIVTVILPLPELGITPEFRDSMHLTGSGEWIERPYTVLAFGALYFSALAWVKYKLTGPDVVPRPGLAAEQPERTP